MAISEAINAQIDTPTKPFNVWQVYQEIHPYLDMFGIGQMRSLVKEGLMNEHDPLESVIEAWICTATNMRNGKYVLPQIGGFISDHTSRNYLYQQALRGTQLNIGRAPYVPDGVMFGYTFRDYIGADGLIHTHLTLAAQVGSNIYGCHFTFYPSTKTYVRSNGVIPKGAQVLSDHGVYVVGNTGSNPCLVY